ncbi:MAG: glutamate--tRNA ligase [Gemmatimonadota bacterium]|nr:MAG: glutamate--tRNA ligase [Gemmatimonadota bacterium]
MGSEVRVRLAPSPTGYLHVGGARTALFNWLFAKSKDGRFILRIEDTDRSRYQEGAVQEILESLRWLGLDWDEGPEVGGDYGPYFQSERTETYKSHAEQLIETGHAYRCFCTPDRLQKLREEQEKAKLPNVSGYDRHCRNLSTEVGQSLLAVKKPHVIRLKIPFNRTVDFHDLIRGEIAYETDSLDDLVLLKSDGFPTYHLANVVDDHMMRISHILRGDEWISSTPKHVLIYEAFGWEPPTFAHMPVILSPDGGKLSKRKGAASVMDYKKAGYLPQALFNFLALLGWSPGDDREKMSREEITEIFSLDRVTPKAAVFDEKKLEWMNGMYMRETSVDSILRDVVRMWVDQGIVARETTTDDPYLRTVVSLLKDRSRTVNELAESATYFFRDPESYEEKAIKKHFKGNAAVTLKSLCEILQQSDSFDHQVLEEVYRAQAETLEIGVGKLIHPTRLAVTGVSYGPGLFELLEALGKENVLRRMKRAVEWLESHQDR